MTTRMLGDGDEADRVVMSFLCCAFHHHYRNFFLCQTELVGSHLLIKSWNQISLRRILLRAGFWAFKNTHVGGLPESTIIWDFRRCSIKRKACNTASIKFEPSSMMQEYLFVSHRKLLSCLIYYRSTNEYLTDEASLPARVNVFFSSQL